MRKRRRLADKMTIMVCAVLIAFSAFFYVPMEVEAQESLVLYDDSSVNVDELLSVDDLGSLELGSNSSLDTYGPYYDTDYLLTFPNCTLVDGLESDILYRIEYSLDIDISTHPITPAMRAPTVHFGNKVLWSEYNPNGELFVPIHSFNYSGVQYFYGSELVNNTFRFDAVVVNPDSQVVIPFSSTFKVDVLSCVPVLNADSDDYQNGYNAGYSAGQTDGYNNGYSDGFLEGEESGFQAGVDSVDTQSYYDAGYEAGYNQAYSVGYNNGFEAGRDSVMLSKGQWGDSVFLGSALNYNLSGAPFYVSSHGLIDMEEYQSGQNGYFYNTVPGTYSGYTDYNFTIPFSTLNNGSMFRVDSDKFEVDFQLSSLRTYLNPNSASATLNANLYNSEIVEAYVTYNGKKFFGQVHNNDDVSFHFQVESFSDLNWLNDDDMAVTIKVQNNVCLVTDADVSLYVGCEYTPKLLFTLGPSSSGYAVMIRPYYGSDNVSANIQNQTDEINSNSNKNTNSIINGFNNSKGESVNSDLSAGLNEFQTAEDSLFSTASSSLSDYQFFNLSSVPAMVTGMSFVSSIMTSWFNQAGGASGVGIVLSILFSIMLVAMVLGLYRWYQSKGGKD